MERRHRLLLTAATIFLFVVPGVACLQSPAVQWADPAEATSLAEALYAVIRNNVQNQPSCSSERSAILAEYRGRFLDATNDILNAQLIQDLPDTLEHTILPAVDVGDVPELTQQAATLLESLLDTEEDPEFQALSSLLALGQARTVLSFRDVMVLTDRLFHESNAPAVLQSLVSLGLQERYGATLAAHLFNMGARRLEADEASSNCAQLELGALHDTLLAESITHLDLNLGPPAWIVLAAPSGLPRVAVDPDTGSLWAPFQDNDGDGFADTDSHGYPVDAHGDPILLPPFEFENRPDPYGRALTATGEPIYEYVNVKNTGLAILGRFGAEALAANVHLRAIAILKAALPEPISCGGDLCAAYPVADSPIADLVWAVLEDLRYDRVGTLLETWHLVMRDDPAVAEDVLISAGQLLSALEQSDLDLTDPTLLQLFEDLLPIIADVFAADSAGQSTARVLLDVIHELGDIARELPEEVAVTMQYVSLHKDPTCSAEPPDLEQSGPVNFDEPRYIYHAVDGWTDNRSSLEQSIELLSAVDCGSVPFSGGKTVAEVVLGTMADSSPETACGVISASLGVIGVSPGVSEVVGSTTLDAIGCDGDEVWSQLMAMDALAKSGVLDAYLPIANAFVEREQTRLLIEIFRLLAQDLQRDEDEDDTTHSALRAALPTFISVIGTGAVDSLFDLDKVLVTVPAADGDGTLADVVVDSFAWITRDDLPVSTRHGEVPNTSLARELIAPLRRILERLQDRDAIDDVEAVVNHVGGYLQRTEVNDNGTTDPGDDEQHLADQRLLPFYRSLLGLLAQTFSLTPAQRDCWFDEVQTSTNDFLAHPDFTLAVELASAYADHEHRSLLDDAAQRWLSPPPPQSRDGFGSLLQVVGALVQVTPEQLQIPGLLRFASSTLEHIDGPSVLPLFDALINGDENQVLLDLARTLFNHGLHGRIQAPVEIYGQMVAEIASVERQTTDPQCLARDGPWELIDAMDFTESAVAFMTDAEHGLPALYHLLSLRTEP